MINVWEYSQSLKESRLETSWHPSTLSEWLSAFLNEIVEFPTKPWVNEFGNLV